MKIRLLTIDNPADFQSYAHLLPLISDERRKKVLSFRPDKEKTISLTAAVFAKKCICEDLNIPFSDVRILVTGNGKPQLSPDTLLTSAPESSAEGSEPSYHFSLSHSGSRIAFVSSERPVGIDLESVRPRIRFADLARRYFTENEYQRIISSSDPADSFCRIWTAKEAFVKMTGEGIAKGLKSFDVFSPALSRLIRSFQIENGYVTVCGKGASEAIVREMGISFLSR